MQLKSHNAMYPAAGGLGSLLSKLLPNARIPLVWKQNSQPYKLLKMIKLKLEKMN
jgi:hypothetical protein